MEYRYSLDGKKVSLLGYGTMRLPTVDGGHANGSLLDASKKLIDQKHLNRQVKRMLDAGITYFDTSPMYCTGASEKAIGDALAASGYDRGSYVLATKLSNFAPVFYPLDAAKKMFANSLQALRTDYIDNYLLHSVGNGGFGTFSKRYLENGALDWCCELRRKRIIRNLGFSFHGDPKVWEWCIAHHDQYKWDFCQIQMNYVDWLHAGEVNPRNLNAKRLYEDLARLNIPVVVMEPLLGGRLAQYNWSLAHELTKRDPEATLASWAFRFCGTFPKVMTILSGMTFDAHIDENINTFSSFKSCTPDDLAALERAAVAMLNLKTVPCTACNYCMPCSYGIDIPSIFDFANRVRASKERLSAKRILALYEKAVPQALRRAEHCTGCGRCTTHCPQNIDIPSELAAIDAWIEGLKNEVSS